MKVTDRKELEDLELIMTNIIARTHYVDEHVIMKKWDVVRLLAYVQKTLKDDSSEMVSVKNPKISLK